MEVITKIHGKAEHSNSEPKTGHGRDSISIHGRSVGSNHHRQELSVLETSSPAKAQK